MNMNDVLRFDELHLRRSKGEKFDAATEIEYGVLLERVVPGKDGQSEFPLGDTKLVADWKKAERQRACAEEIFKEIKKQAIAHGPELLALLKALLSR